MDKASPECVLRSLSPARLVLLSSCLGDIVCPAQRQGTGELRCAQALGFAPPDRQACSQPASQPDARVDPQHQHDERVGWCNNVSRPSDRADAKSQYSCRPRTHGLPLRS
jgi:hypothetical protein